MFNLQLSVSTQTPKDRLAAEKATQFEVKDVAVLEPLLKELFTSRLSSTNQWKDGKCKNANFVRMSGITVDIDKGVTIAEAKEIFKEYNFILHTSTSHKADIPTKGGIQDRFRVILPFAPADYAQINSEDLAEATYAGIMKKYPFVDGACADPARKYFPFLSRPSLALFELFINDVGKYYAVDINEVKNAAKNIGAGNAKPSTDEYILSLEHEVTLTDGVTKVKIRDIKKKTVCYCVFCDDLNSKSPSAFVEIHPSNKRYYLYCSHCQKTYWLSLKESFPDVFFLDNMIMRIMVQGGNVTVGRMALPYLNKLPKDVREDFEHELTQSRNFSADSFTVSRMVDPFGSKMRYELNWEAGTLDVWTPPIPVVLQDNEYINRWLISIFGKYTDFIKMWMAIWTHQNHQPLPMLVFNGPRGVGKSTFGEFLQNMYPPLVMDWRGESQNFTDYLEKKLLLIEEVPADKRDQYVEIKKTMGSDIVTVNKKFKQPYRIKNNLNIILLTNNFTPMYLHEDERPLGPETNQFFMFNFERDVRYINANIKNELKERAGHYLRTELRDLYEGWKASPAGRQNRYGLPSPITDFELQQFDDARSTIDYECDFILKTCLIGLNMYNKEGVLIERLGPYDTVNAEELRHIMNSLRLETRNLRTIRERLQSLRYFSATGRITKDGHNAWRVIGSLPESSDLNDNAPLQRTVT